MARARRPIAIEVIVEATGNPAAGIRHARAAIAAGKHIVMVNVEADVLAGPLLAEEARKAGVVYSLAYGDQPALTAEMVDWARATGFRVVAAGKGTKYLPAYHEVTPDGVWGHYGLTADEAKAAGMNPQMFNSFLDGTKSAIEMAAIANATGLDVPARRTVVSTLRRRRSAAGDAAARPGRRAGEIRRGGSGVVAGARRTAGVPRPALGRLCRVRSAERLRRGLFQAVRTEDRSFRAICGHVQALSSDRAGAEHFDPVRSAARWRPTGQPRGFRGDVVSVAKRDLRAGEMLDGEGGYTVWGKLMPAAASLKAGALPIGLAHHVKLKNDIARGAVVRWSDVEIDAEDATIKTRRAMEARFGGRASV